jgi:hypothetical protein
MTLVIFDPSYDLNGRGVATEPLLRGLLAVILGDADRFEALRVLVAAETCRKSRESVATVSTFSFDFIADLAPRGDHGPRIATFIDVLTQVLWRKSMIGLTPMTPCSGCCIPPGAWLPRALLLLS